MITGSVEYEHSLPVKMHRALLSVEDTAILNDRTPVSRAVGPHLPDQLVPVTAMDNVKSLHKAKKQARKKVVKTGVNVNASDTGRCVIWSCIYIYIYIYNMYSGTSVIRTPCDQGWSSLYL